LRVGFQKVLLQKVQVKLSGGVDNLFDQKYSLGNDANGFGGRYYNAAAGRNYFATLAIQFAQNK
jgi:iron complex outermembrane receptor protein